MKELEYNAILRERLRIQQQIGETSLEYFNRQSLELKNQAGQIEKEYKQVWEKLQQEQYITTMALGSARRRPGTITTRSPARPTKRWNRSIRRTNWPNQQKCFSNNYRNWRTKEKMSPEWSTTWTKRWRRLSPERIRTPSPTPSCRALPRANALPRTLPTTSKRWWRWRHWKNRSANGMNPLPPPRKTGWPLKASPAWRHSMTRLSRMQPSSWSRWNRWPARPSATWSTALLRPKA